MTKLRVITSPSGARFTVADEHADKFGGLVKDLEAAGIKINPNASGGYNPRNIRGSNRPSNHAFGRAIDVNWDENQMGTAGKINPEVARSLAAKYGMTWGGDWKRRPDPMHFEIAGVPNVPVSQRAFTRVAGVQQTEPPTKGAPTPMPSYKNVGGQTYMGPEAAQQSRRLAEMLINQGTNQEPMTHWTQALGKVLMTGSGALRNDMAMRDVREGQAAGNQALASMLMGGDASAAMTNPYSSEAATKYMTEQNDPLYKLKLQKAQADLQNPSSNMPSNVQEWEYFSKLPKDKQQQYLNMKRSIPFLDRGPDFMQPNIVDPTQPGNVIPKNIVERERQEKVGAALGEGQLQLPKTATALQQYEIQQDVVRQDIDRAIETAKTGFAATGMGGGITRNIWGTPGFDLKSTLNTVKGNIGFDKLQSMRENSPTGGALGQVAVQELETLQSVFGSLEQAQSQEQIVKNLERLKQIQDQFRLLKRDAYQRDVARFGAAAVPNPETGAAPAAPAAPAQSRPDPLGLFGGAGS